MRAASGGPRRSARAVGERTPSSHRSAFRPASCGWTSTARWRSGTTAGATATREPLGADLSSPAARQRPPALADRRGRAHRPDHGLDGLPPQSGRAHHRRAGRRQPRLRWAWRWGSPGRSRSSARCRSSASGSQTALRPRRRRPAPTPASTRAPPRRTSFFQQFDASLARWASGIAGGDFDGDPALKARAADHARRTRPRSATICSGSWPTPLTASPFVPTATSTAGTAVTTRLTTLQTTLASDFGVAGFSALPPCRPSPRRQPTLLAALGDPSGPDRPAAWTRASSPSAATRRRESPSRWWIAGTGDAVAAASARRSEGLVRFPTGERGAARPRARPRHRRRADRRRVPHHRRPRRRPLGPSGGGDVQPPARGGLHPARGPTDPAARGTRPAERRAARSGRHREASRCGRSSGWRRPSRSRARRCTGRAAQDEVSYLTADDEIPGVDASVLAQDTKASATVLGIGITYSNPGKFREGGRGCRWMRAGDTSASCGRREGSCRTGIRFGRGFGRILGFFRGADGRMVGRSVRKVREFFPSPSP